MALGDSYATRDEYKARVRITTVDDDSIIDAALSAASRSVELATGRQFNKVTVASARVFSVASPHRAIVDDFHTTAGLVVETDGGDDGTFTTDWSSSDYELEPLNGVVLGQTGWPYYRIRAVGSYWFPTCAKRRGVLRVTAQWGWTAVPANIKEATLIVAEELVKLKDAPFGVAGFGEFGAVRVRENPVVMRLLDPYRTSEQALMVA